MNEAKAIKEETLAEKKKLPKITLNPPYSQSPKTQDSISTLNPTPFSEVIIFLNKKKIFKQIIEILKIPFPHSIPLPQKI